MKIVDIRAYFLILFLGDVGIGKAYSLGYVQIDDVPNFLKKQLKKGSVKKGFFKKILAFVLNKIKKNTIIQAKKNIISHYDIGNDFYKEWLDPTMTYSSGIFLNASENLHKSQLNKYSAIVKKLNLTDQNVLEIGCGWGGFISYLMRNTQCTITAITISEEQYQYCLQQIKNNNWEHRVKLMCIDYRDLPTNIQFDAVVSIEMVEALGHEYWDAFFYRVSHLLKKDGECLIQAITLNLKNFNTYLNGTDFIRTYIFPGGCLVQLSYLINNSILSFVDSEEFSYSYIRTLQIWESHIKVKEKQLSSQYSPEFIRLWLFYLYYSIATFECKKAQVGHFLFKNNKKTSDSI